MAGSFKGGEEVNLFFWQTRHGRKDTVVNQSENGRKNGKPKREKPIRFVDLQSGLQAYLVHRSPNQGELSDAQVKAFWSEFRLQNSDPEVDLNVDTSTMRRIMKSAVESRLSKLKRNRSKLMAGAIR